MIAIERVQKRNRFCEDIWVQVIAGKDCLWPAYRRKQQGELTHAMGAASFFDDAVVEK